MTPWDVITTTILPAGVAVVALTGADLGPVSSQELLSFAAAGVEGSLEWTSPPHVDGAGSLATRTARVTFRPPSDGSRLTVQGMALVDTANAGVALGMAWLLQAEPLSAETGFLVMTGAFVVTRTP